MYNYLKSREHKLKHIQLNNVDKVLKDVQENIMILELMITKEKPILELANKDDFFAFDNTFNTNKEYLKENITGNKDIKVLKYKFAPFIKMPIAQ